MSGDYPFVATIHRPRLPDIHLGFAFQFQAEHASWSLTEDLIGTAHVPGTTITFSATPEGVTPEPPVPAEALSVSVLIDEEDDSLPIGHAFPDLFSRLKAQEGPEEAHRIWRDACRWLDTEPAEDEDSE